MLNEFKYSDQEVDVAVEYEEQGSRGELLAPYILDLSVQSDEVIPKE